MISIIIPCYNVEKYVGQCIESIQRQNIDDIEVICLDDASKDRTLEILNEYANNDKRIKVVHSEKNLKQGKQRNVGIGMAQGEFILFLDSDDWLCDDSLSMLLECSRRTNADVVTGDYIEYCQSSGERRRDYLFVEEEKILSKKEYLEQCTFSCRKLYKTDFLKENDIVFAEGIFYEDTVFRYISSWYVKKAVYIRVPIIFYRRHDTNTTAHTTPQNEYYKFIASAKILEDARRRGFSDWYYSEIIKKYSNDSLAILLEMYIGFDSFEEKYANLIRNQIKINSIIYPTERKMRMVYKLMLKYPKLMGLLCVVYRKIR